MLCRRCGILGDRIHQKWWHKVILPGSRRYYCAGCGKTFLSFYQPDEPAASPPGASASAEPPHTALTDTSA